MAKAAKSSGDGASYDAISAIMNSASAPANNNFGFGGGYMNESTPLMLDSLRWGGGQQAANNIMYHPKDMARPREEQNYQGDHQQDAFMAGVAYTIDMLMGGNNNPERRENDNAPMPYAPMIPGGHYLQSLGHDAVAAPMDSYGGRPISRKQSGAPMRRGRVWEQVDVKVMSFSRTRVWEI
tara:strand:- start:1082 stop:1624 length:543 start_codon:yes stop_codon:yes gene_type:complete